MCVEEDSVRTAYNLNVGDGPMRTTPDNPKGDSNWPSITLKMVESENRAFRLTLGERDQQIAILRDKLLTSEEAIHNILVAIAAHEKASA